MKDVTNNTLTEINVEFKNKSACCVIMASKGYPQSYEKGFEISIPDDVLENVYIAGASIKENKLFTNGGRVLGCTATAETLNDAITNAYKILDKVKFDNAYFRNDIGARALKATVEE